MKSRAWGRCSFGVLATAYRPEADWRVDYDFEDRVVSVMASSEREAKEEALATLIDEGYTLCDMDDLEATRIYESSGGLI